jgi:hypothetical protein
MDSTCTRHKGYQEAHVGAGDAESTPSVQSKKREQASGTDDHRSRDESEQAHNAPLNARRRTTDQADSSAACGDYRQQSFIPHCTELACPQFPRREAQSEVMRRLHVRRHIAWLCVPRRGDGSVLPSHCWMVRRRYDDAGTNDHGVEARYEAAEVSQARDCAYGSRIAVCGR